MEDFLESLAKHALNHVGQQQVKYGMLLAALAFSSGCSWINRYLSAEALNHGTPADFDWGSEIVLVTGGAGGIGGEIVRKLAKRGTAVVVLDVMDLTYDAPPSVHYYACDITKPDALKAVAEQIKQDVGEPTVIVANAGICRGKALLDESERDVELTFGVNTLGLLWTVKTFLPSLVERNHGHLLLVASATGFLTTARSIDYCASKAAAISIYEGLHSEIKHVYGSPAVRISCVSPSLVKTDMFKGFKPIPGMVGSGMKPSYVADQIVDILYSGRAQNVVLSKWAFPPGVMRVMPEWMRVRIQDRSAASLTDLEPHDPMASKL